MKKLPEKIISLRKERCLTQEELAELLNVSRQAISRWESGTALPDAANLLQLSRLFGVSSDYLLNDDYLSDSDLPKVKENSENNLKQLIIFLLTLEVMILLLQFISAFFLQNTFFTALTLVPFAALIGGFEYSFQKNRCQSASLFRKKFYGISVWLGTYFPIRIILRIFLRFIPGLSSFILFEIITLAVYFAAAALLRHIIMKKL